MKSKIKKYLCSPFGIIADVKLISLVLDFFGYMCILIISTLVVSHFTNLHGFAIGMLVSASLFIVSKIMYISNMAWSRDFDISGIHSNRNRQTLKLKSLSESENFIETFNQIEKERNVNIEDFIKYHVEQMNKN